MARMCNKCANEGRLLGTDDYCKCLYGRQLKAKDEQAAKRREEKQAEKPVKKESKKRNNFKEAFQKPKKPSYAVSEGDWTKFGDLYGVVGQLKDGQALFQASHAFTQKGKREEVRKHSWVDAARLVPAPLETFDNDLDMKIEWALMTKDEGLFYECMKLKNEGGKK